MSQDISPEVVKKTQKILGKFVKKPPLTEKLLKKPPFRFLHDIVKSVIKETGFLRGLFTEDELKSENVTEKGAKIAFLNKLIDAVKTLTNTDLEVKASKIVAGLEPNNTNVLLQCIGKALESNVDSKQYVSHLSDGHEVPKKKSNEASKVKSKSKEINVKKNEEEPAKAKKIMTPKEKTSSRVDKTSPPADKTSNAKEIVKKRKTESKRKNDDRKAVNNDLVSPKESPKVVETSSKLLDDETQNNDITEGIKIANMNGPCEEVEAREVDSGISLTDGPPSTNLVKDGDREATQLNGDKRRSSASLIRPKSARPKSGERGIQKGVANNHQEHLINPLEMTSLRGIPKSALLRPPSARPPSARPAAPRLQARPDSALPIGEPVVLGSGVSVIVEGADDMVDEEETVVIEEVGSDLLDERPSPTDDLGRVSALNDNKGQLVEQILEQIGEEERKTDLKKVVEMEWEAEALRGGVSKDVGQLRNYVQSITKTTSSLGKLMSYLHEDIDAMQSELQMWTNTRKQLFNEINKQKKLNEESTKPLLEQLTQLQDEIRKQEHDILDLQSRVQRNDLRIKELLSAK